MYPIKKIYKCHQYTAKKTKIITNNNGKEATLKSGLPPYNLGPCVLFLKI
jgi:hypothetical protein